MFEITFLGTAAAMPSPQRSLPSIALRKDGGIFLLDCGEGAQRQMMKSGLSFMKVKAIFISHLHVDHFLGVFGLVKTMGMSNRECPLRIYGPQGSKRIFEFLGKSMFLDIVEIGSGLIADEGEFTVSAFPVKHKVESFGFAIEEKAKARFYEEKAKALGIRGRMFSEISSKGELLVSGKKIKLKDVTYSQPGKKIVYSGDTMPCPPLARAAKGADLLIHESTFADDRKKEAKETMHSTAKQAAQCAKKAGAKKLAITHFSGRYKDESALLKEAKEIFPCTVAAKDGLRIEV